MKPAFDLTLYLVTDPDLTGGRDLAEIVAAAVDGGVTLVQLRDKHADTGPLIAQAQALLRVLRPRGVPLIVNDRVDVALAVGAEGVHVGQTDMPAETARRLLGPDAVIGVSASTEAEVAAVDPAVADYAGLGAAYATPTKPESDALDPATFRALRGRLPLPVVAIGGLTAGNLARPMADGCDGVAVVSAICAAPDPRAAAAHLKQAVLAAKRKGTT